MTFKAKAKLTAAVVLAVLVAVVVFQNTDPVQTRFLFMSFIMPRAALLLMTLLVGIVFGVLIGLVFAKRPKR